MHKPENRWIWMPSWNMKDEEEPSLVYFRKEMLLDEEPDSFRIHISADTRYKLYLNGQLCEIGPTKGDREIWFYDEVDIAPFLKQGMNVWAVIVLRYPADERKGNMSLFRTSTPGLHIESAAKDMQGEPLWKTDRTWKTRKQDGFRIVSENPFFAPMQIYENNEGVGDTIGWMEAGYDASEWENAWEYGSGMSGNMSPGNLKARTIPFMKKIHRRFECIRRVNNSSMGMEKWTAFLNGGNNITIPANSCESVDIDAGELMTGLLKLRMAGGNGARIELHQAECYVQSLSGGTSYDDLPQKGDRTDSEKGLLEGNSDVYIACGGGSPKVPEIYEPFWFRTFRFIRLTIETGNEPITLLDFDYLETGYPLEVKSKVECSDETMAGIWEISERTLRRCMHETYMDCPFYEQLQYAMDSRSQILYTYAVSGDDRLARRCIDDFGRSQRYNGLLNASYPNVGVNIIPGFSIFYIGMLYDHMMYFGDKELIKYHILTVDGILEYYNRHREERGLVKKIGDLNRPDRYWSFIDWTPEWKETNGVPFATLQGPITMESLLYILGLQYAIELNRYIGRTQIAEIYEVRRENMQKAINSHCRDNRGMYKDGPDCAIYSQHCQVFAVLTDTVSVQDGKTCLLETLRHKENYAQCSVAMMYYLFRALEKCDLYEETDALWDVWREMLANHMTTCAEDSLASRSDCHAWGALALYELPSVILGVRPTAPGYEKIEVKPVPGKLRWAKGEVITSKGMVKVEWRKERDELEVSFFTEFN